MKRNVNAFNFCREGTMTYRTNRAVERQTKRKIIPSFAKTKTRAALMTVPGGRIQGSPTETPNHLDPSQGAFSTISAAYYVPQAVSG